VLREDADADVQRVYSEALVKARNPNGLRPVDEKAADAWAFWPMAAVLGASGLVMFASAQSRDFWGDEVIAIYTAKQVGLNQVLESMAGLVLHPPLYNYVLHFWMALAGESETVVRLPSILFEVLSILVVFRIGSFVLDRRFGLFLAAMTALSPFLILFGSMARWYSLSLLLSLLSVFYFLTITSQAGSKQFKNWTLYALSTILLNYTHFLTYSIIAAQNVFHIHRHRRDLRALRNWILCQVFVLIASFFSIQSLLTQAIGEASGQAEAVDLANSALSYLVMLLYVPTSFSLGETLLPWDFLITIPALPLFLLLAVKGGLSLHRVRPEIAWLWFLYAVLALAFGSVAFDLADLPISMISSHLIFIAPLYYSVLAMGIRASRSSRVRFLLSAGIAVVFGLSIVNLLAQRDFHNPTYRIPWRQIVSEMSSRIQEGDVIVSMNEVAFDYYLKRSVTGVKLLHYDLDNRSYAVYDSRTGDKEPLTPTAFKALVKEAAYPYLWLVTRDRGARGIVELGETVRETLRRNHNRVDMMLYVKEDPRTVRLKSRLLGRDVPAYKIWVERYQKKSADGAMGGSSCQDA